MPMLPELPDLRALIAEIDQRAGDEGELDRLAAAEDLAAELAALGTRLVGYFVEQARVQGSSWADIGAHRGISKQAAQQRYTPSRFRLTVSDLVGTGSLVRFTERTHAMLRRAELHAEQQGSGAVDPQHILLSILEDHDTLAIRALDTLCIDRDLLRIALDPHEIAASAAPSGSLPLSDAARRMLEQALTQAFKLGHNYVGTEHLLLALTHYQHETAGKLLKDHGVTYEGAHSAVRAVIDAYLQSR